MHLKKANSLATDGYLFLIAVYQLLVFWSCRKQSSFTNDTLVLRKFPDVEKEKN